MGRIRAEIEADIRPAVAADLPALEWMGLFAHHQRLIRETFESQQQGRSLMLLAISAGFPIAQVWIDFAPEQQADTALLWAVRTFHPLQGAGIGRQMMAAAEAELRRRGLTRAELEVERSNAAALRFYQRAGWRIEREISDSAPKPPGLRHPPTDGWVLAKGL
jgi:ribosomal protein S18 acetylase RimI-like enzyme